jgi:uncharacterized protein (DUF58 family)
MSRTTTTDRAEPASRTPSQSLIALRGLQRAVVGGLRNAARLTGQALGRVFAFAAPVTRVVSPVGWIVFSGAVVAFALSRFFGWVEFGYVGATLAAALLVAVAFVFGRTNFGVRIELNPHRVVAGERALGRMVVTNIAAKPSIPSRMELPVGGGTAEFVIPVLAPQAEHDELFAVPTHRRAVIVAGPAITVRGDQLGLLRRTVRWTDEVELFVHPVTARLAPSAAGLVRDLEGEITKTITNDDISFHALRSYEPGDALRNVHWRTSARTGQLMVRQFEETRRAHLAVSLSINTDEYASEQEFEMAVSAAASIGRQAIREQRELNVLTQSGPVRCETGRSMLDGMTRIEGAPLRMTAVDLARTLADTVPNASVVFFVVGSQVSPAQLSSAAASVAPGVRSLAVRVEAGAAPAPANIADLTVLTLGELSDLPAVLRKAAA